MKPSDLEKAREIFNAIGVVCHEITRSGEVHRIAEALAAERASLPESVVNAIENYASFGGELDTKALEDLRAWRDGK